MRLFFMVLCVGLISLASCSESREAASNSAKSTGLIAQPEQAASANREQQGHTNIPQGHAHKSDSGHGDHPGEKSNANAESEKHDSAAESAHRPGGHDQASHAHVGQHSSHGREHGSDSHAHPKVSDNAKKIMVGERVPDFEVTIAGKKWKLSELRRNAEMTKDGTLLLTFWCSFCHSCRHVEHPLNDLAKKYKNRAGVIALDASAGETTETVAKFAEKRGLSLPIALNAHGTAADIFGVGATTTTVVIDSHGVLRYRGQFMDNQHTFAKDALRAVLAGNDVPQKETPQKG